MLSGELLARANSRLGTVLNGKYRLDRVLGIGGMAVVFQATHRNGRAVAVKMLHAELSINSEIRGRFLKEGQAANAVRHPGVVAILDDDVADDGTAFLVMEFLDGASLEDLQEAHGGKLPLQPVVAAGIHILGVLRAADAQGIVHRDVKPANVFITRDGHLKVLDFGIARVKDLTSGVTQSGTTMGTPGFMAPEQAAGRTSEVDALTDVWAVGATIYTLLAGRLVHDGESAQEIAIRSATLPVTPLSSILEDLPPAISLVLDRALAFEKADRWPSAGAMRVTLAAAHHEVFGGDVKRRTLMALFTPSVRAQSRAEGGTMPLLPQLGAKDRSWPANALGASGAKDAVNAAEEPLAGPAPAPPLDPAGTVGGTGAGTIPARRLLVAAAACGAAAILATVATRRVSSSEEERIHADAAPLETIQVPVSSTASSYVLDARAVPIVSFESLQPASAAPTLDGAVPSVSFDSLPRASSGSALPQALPDRARSPILDAAGDLSTSSAGPSHPGTSRAAPGSLSIAATGGYCDVTLDGVRVGVTPLAGLQVDPGRHHVLCWPPGKPAMEATVDVSVGGMTRYRFVMPEKETAE